MLSFTLATNDLSASPPRNQRGYLRSQENVTTLTHNTSDSNNNTGGSGFSALLTGVSKPPTADVGADGYGLGNFTVHSASSDVASLATVYSYLCVLWRVRRKCSNIFLTS